MSAVGDRSVRTGAAGSVGAASGSMIFTAIVDAVEGIRTAAVASGDAAGRSGSGEAGALGYARRSWMCRHSFVDTGDVGRRDIDDSGDHDRGGNTPARMRGGEKAKLWWGVGMASLGE